MCLVMVRRVNFLSASEPVRIKVGGNPIHVVILSELVLCQSDRLQMFFWRGSWRKCDNQTFRYFETLWLTAIPLVKVVVRRDIKVWRIQWCSLNHWVTTAVVSIEPMHRYSSSGSVRVNSRNLLTRQSSSISLGHHRVVDNSQIMRLTCWLQWQRTVS